MNIINVRNARLATTFFPSHTAQRVLSTTRHFHNYIYTAITCFSLDFRWRFHSERSSETLVEIRTVTRRVKIVLNRVQTHPFGLHVIRRPLIRTTYSMFIVQKLPCWCHRVDLTTSAHGIRHIVGDIETTETPSYSGTRGRR